MSKYTLTINTDDAAEITRLLGSPDIVSSDYKITANTIMPPAPFVGANVTAPIETANGFTITPAGTVQPSDDDDATGGAADPNSLDSDGVPWDERIHASTKTKTAKGKWTKQRGCADDLYKSVTAELKARQPAAQAPQQTGPFPPVPPGIVFPGAPQQQAPIWQPGVAMPFAPPAGFPGAAASPPSYTVEHQPAPTVTPQQAPAGFTGAPMQFGEFMPLFGQAWQSGKLSQEKLQEYLTYCGIPSIEGMQNDPAAVGRLYAALQAGGIM